MNRTSSVSSTLNFLAVLSVVVSSAIGYAATAAATPTFSPGGGTYNTTQTVTISDTTPGATIYYTTDGSTPGTSSSQYSGIAISVGVTTKIQAIATATGFTQSSVGSATYTIVPPGTAGTLQVFISPPSAQSTAVSGVTTETFNEVTLTGNKYGSNTLASTIGTYVGNNTRIPIIAADQYGGANSSQYMYVGSRTTGDSTSVTLTLKSPVNYFGFWWSAGDQNNRVALYSGSTLYGTFSTADLLSFLNNGVGSLTASNGTQYSASSYFGNPNITSGSNDSTEPFAYVSFVITGNATINKIVFYNQSSSGFESDNHSVISSGSSVVIPGTYVPVEVLTLGTQVIAPTFNPPGGNYSGPQTVSISSTTAGALINYTVDGSTPSPTNGTSYTQPITIGQTETVQAIGFETGMTASPVAFATYTIPVIVTVAPATASLHAGGTQQFTATVANTSNAAVRWSISPNVGAVTQAGLYTAPTPITSQQTVNVIATSQADGVTSGSATVTLMPPATPTITWATPAPITYGTALSATQLDATANVPGTFAYSPAAGTIVSAGSPTLNVTFTPTDTADYATAIASVTLPVNKAALSVTVNNQTMIYGSSVPTLAGTMTGILAGDGITVSYSTAGTSSSPAGAYPITATLNDPNSKLTNYTVTNTPGTLTINKVGTSITCSPSAIVYGTALSASNLNCTAGGVAGAFSYTPTLGAVLAAGTQSISVTFTPTDTTDYTTATASVALTVTPATLTATANNIGITYGAAIPQLTYAIAGFVNTDSSNVVTGAPSLTTTATASSPVGNYPITVTIGTLAAANYQFAFSEGTLTIASVQCASNGYSYVRGITIDHTKVPNTDQVDFPFLFSTTDPLLAAAANNGHVANPNGYDIIFTSDPAGQNPLAYEMEEYDPTGKVVAWVRIPTLSHTSDTVIYMYYGNPNITASQQNSAGVWDSNYLGVWHLPNGTILSGSDSTANGNNLTNRGATPTTGIIDGGASFNGSSDLLVEVGMTVSAPFTIEEWAFPTSSGSTLGLFGSRSPSDDSFDAKLNGSGVHGDIGNGAGWLTTSADAGFSKTMSMWHHIAYVVGASGYTIYVDALPVGSGSLNGTAVLADSSHTLSLGWTGNDGEYFSGILDEARVSNSTRSADWITTDYANQRSPETFYSLSTENQAITPSAVTLFAQQSQQFTVTAFASCPASVVWSMSRQGVGTLTPDGATSVLYTAPANIAAQQTVTITASNIVTNDTSSAAVTLMPPTTNPTVTLAAEVPPPYVVGASQTFVGTFKNLDGTPLHDIPMTFTVIGANPSSGTVMTDANGVALYTYTGASAGIDTLQANGSAGSEQAISNKLTASWIIPLNPVSTTTVLGRFFSLTGQCCWFDIPPGTPPAFSQFFPTIDFNPPSGSIPGDITVGVDNRPFTDVTVDKNGNFSGSIIAQGNGYQAGAGPLAGFEAVFTGSFIVAGSGDVAIPIYVDNSFILGIGGGATRVSGPFGTQSATTPFEQYPVMGSLSTSISGTSIVVDFPGPGTYPYELDYVEDGIASQSLIMTAGTPGSNGLAPGVPSGGTLMLSPNSVPAQPLGGHQSFTALATDAAGNPVPNLSVGLVVSLDDTADLSAITDNTGTATFTYVNSAPGTDQVQAVAMIDGMVAYSNQVAVPWTLPPGTGTGGGTSGSLTVNISGYENVVFPNKLQLTGSATDTNLPQGDTISYAWSANPATVTFTNTQQQPPSATASFTQPGIYQLELTASEVNIMTSAPDATASAQITVTVDQPGTSQGWIGSPQNGAQVSGIVPITIVPGETLTSCTLSVYPANNPTVVTKLNCNTSGSGPIATWDTTELNNGTYWIALQGTDANNNSSYNLALVTVVGDYKPGRVTSTVTDLVVPATGLPIQIQRTYDSLNASTVGDFGFGWNLGINVNLTVDNKGNVTFTLGGQRKTFYLTPQVLGCSPLIGCPFSWYSPIFAPEPGLHGTLTDSSPGCPLDMMLSDGECVGGGYYNPPGYIYTDPNGTAYTIGASGALQSITDRSGNGLTISANGITSSTGLNVPFVRDGQGRITQITDPQNNVYSYSYDNNGNLASVTYPPTPNAQTCSGANASNTSQYSYYPNSEHPDYPAHYYAGGTDGRCNPLPVTTYFDGTNDGGNSSLDGRLASVTDSAGNTTSYTYVLSTTSTINGVSVSNTGVTTVTYPTDPADGNGQPDIATMVYDSQGDLLSSTDPLGHTTTNTYDANRNLLSTTDPLGNITCYTYDSNGNKLSTTLPQPGPNCSSIMSTTNYNQYSEPTQTTDEDGNIRTFNYDDNFNPQSVTDSLGTLMSTSFNDDGTMATGAIGHDISVQPSVASQFTYDANGNLASKTDALGRTTSYTYNSLGQKTQMIEPIPSGSSAAAVTTNYQYDAFGNLTQASAPLGRVTSSQYDANGNKTSDTDARNNTTNYQYDALNRLIETDYPDGFKKTVDLYDFRNNVVKETDQNGHVTQHQYDLAGRQTSVTMAFGTANATTTSYTYYDDGRKKSETDGAGHITNYTYDAAGNLQSISGAKGNFSYTYDKARNQVSMTDGKNNTTKYQYDARKRLTETDYPDGHKKTNTYDGPGNLASVTDQAQNQVQYEYDAANQLIHVIQVNSPNAGADTTIFGYDANGNPIVLTDANTHTTNQLFDAMSELTKKTLPDGQLVESRTYDNNGNLQTVTHFNNAVTTYTYDQLNRLQSRSTTGGPLSDAAVSFTYTKTGKRATMTDASGPTNYFYDAMDRLTQKQTPEGTLNYTYDAAGNLASMQSADGAVNVSYTWNSLNLLEQAIDSRLGTTNYTYDPANNVYTLKYPNQIVNTYLYDQLNRLTDVQSTQAQLGPYHYGLDATGKMKSVSEPGGRNVTWSYDGINRLTGETITGDPSKNGAVSYTLDPVGNRTSVNSGITGLSPIGGTFDADDELTSEGYADQNGNVTSSGGKTFTYDSLNEMVSMANPGSGTTVALVYDGDGNRVAKSVQSNGATTSTLYLVDDLNPTGYPQVVEELNGSGVATRTYTYGMQRISEYQQVSSVWTPSFYQYDGGGNVRQLTNSTGTVTDSYEYDAFGNHWTAEGSTPNNMLYQGEEWDPDLSLVYLRARFMNPLTGRFLSRDPEDGDLTNPATLHKYIYAGGDPVNFADPSGRAGEAVAPGRPAIGGALGEAVVLTLQIAVATMAAVDTYACAVNIRNAENALGVLQYKDIVPAGLCSAKGRPRKCKPCDPPVEAGDYGYQLHVGQKSDHYVKATKMWIPAGQTHWHLFQCNQTPPSEGCVCRWNKIRDVAGVGTTPPGFDVDTTACTGGGVEE